MSISSVNPVSAVRTAAPVQPVQPVETPPQTTPSLAPAVRVDIRSGDAGRQGAGDEARAAPEPTPAEQDKQRITIDQATKTLVYQVVDPNSGDVVVQLPDPTVLKARAYAETAAAHARATDHPLDLSA